MKFPQIVWWYEKPRFRKWKYPPDWKYPIFNSYHFGIFELRFHKDKVGKYRILKQHKK